MATFAEILSGWERKRREFHCLNPNKIWFQRHNKNPNIIAEVCLVNDLYRWRVYDSSASYDPCAEGNGSTLSEAKKQVFEDFQRR
jgi:hypothetical protein